MFLLLQQTRAKYNTFHKYQTFELDQRLKPIATAICDAELMKKLANCDLVAAEKKCQFRCLTNIFKKYRSYTKFKSVEKKERYRKKGFRFTLLYFLCRRIYRYKPYHNKFENL